MNSEELIRQIVLQAKSEQYGRDRGWIVVKLPISDRDLSLYVKEAGDRGLVEVTNLTSLDSGYDEWKIRGITALGLRFLQHPTSETASDKHPEADKSAKIYFLVGSFVALLAVGLPLIGVTVNFWLGGAMLTLAFVSVVRAFWIWEKSSKFHVLLRIGTIAVAAFVYFGFTGRQILTQYRAEHSTEKVETLPRDSGIKSIPADSAEKPTKRTSKLGPTLPPLRGQTEFLTYVMLDSSSKVFCSSKMQPIRLESCNEIHNIFEKIPKTENDTPSALASVLQHDAVAMIFAAGQRWGMYGAGDRAFVHDFVAPIEPPDVQTYTPHSVTQMAESDYFPDGLRFMWNQPQMKLPKDTKISFLDVPSENQGPVCNVVRLERKAYYRIDFCFKKYQDIALPPQEYESEQVGQINTHAFEVIVSWTVERSHDATFVVADYDNWAKQLAGRIQNRLMF